MKIKNRMHRQPWTEDDDELLTILFVDNHMMYSQIMDYFPGRSSDGIRGRIKTLGLGRYKKESSPIKGKELIPDIDINTFFPLNTRQNCYVYGLLVTDGCIMKDRLSFNSVDKELVDLVYDTFKCGKVYLRKSGPYKIWQYEYSRKRIYRSFEKIGLGIRKTKVLNWDTLINNIPQEYHRDFVRGLWDGDGCMYIGKVPGSPHLKRYTITFASASKEMVYPMMEYLRNIVPTNSNVQIMKNNFYHITFSYKNATILSRWLYTNSGKLRLERKFTKFYEYLKRK